MLTDQLLRSDFASLFTYPLAPNAIPDILAQRNWRRFEQFVDYIFERAGYIVKDVSTLHRGDNIDLEIYSPSALTSPVAIVQVKLYQADVTPELVHAFGGVTENAKGAFGYFVAAGGFTQIAIDQAKSYPHLRLIDGQMLLRYITYIIGARLPDDPKTLISLESLIDANKVSRRSISDCVIMAVANEKGGVGKTTSAINLGTWLGEQGKRVLVIDLDTQSNLTGRMPLGRELGQGAKLPTMVDYFLGNKPLSDLVLPTKYKNVYCIASHENVKLTARGVSEWTNDLLNFARDANSLALRPPPYEAPSFEWIILDTPTADEYRIRVALSASHVVVAPVIPSVFGFAGLNALFASVESVKALMGSGLGKKGCFLTQCESLKVKSL